MSYPIFLLHSPSGYKCLRPGVDQSQELGFWVSHNNTGNKQLWAGTFCLFVFDLFDLTSHSPGPFKLSQMTGFGFERA